MRWYNVNNSSLRRLRERLSTLSNIPLWLSIFTGSVVILDLIFCLKPFLQSHLFNHLFVPIASTPQFRYKSRVYRQPHVDEKQIAKLHTKVRIVSCRRQNSYITRVENQSVCAAKRHKSFIRVCEVPALTSSRDLLTALCLVFISRKQQVGGYYVFTSTASVSATL